MEKALAAIAIGVSFQAFVACGDIVHPDPQGGLDDRIILTAILDPTARRHAVAASPAEDQGPGLTQVLFTMHLRTTSSGQPGWTRLVSAKPVGGTLNDEEERLCATAVNIYHLETSGSVCAILDAELVPGETYRVEVSAEGRPTAGGTTRAVGDFQVQRAMLSRDNGSPVLAATWSASAYAHRYLAGLRRWETTCFNCSEAWFVDLDSTQYTGPVPQEKVDSAGSTPAVTVAALDRHLHAFVTSGHGWDLFAVSPVMNIDNGLGVVGTAIVRTVPIVLQDDPP
jgi:hypothetical protein